jgi:hypothetical protein
LNKIEQAGGGRYFFGQKDRVLVEDPYFCGENALRPTDNEREYRQAGSGTRQGE